MNAPYATHWDTKTRSKKQIDIEHAMIHLKKHYYFFDDDTKDNTEVKRWLIRTGAEKEPHLVLIIDTTKAGRIKIYEDFQNGGAGADDGTELTVFNNYRKHQGDAPAGLKFFKDTVIGATPTMGTIIWNRPTVDPGIAVQPVGGPVVRSREWILYKGKDYLVEYTSGDNTNIINIEGEFYEIKE